MAIQTYGRISSVEPNSPADDAGLMAGDELVSVNGRPVADVLDCCYLCSQERLSIEVSRANKVLKFRIVKDEAEELGLTFEEELFDGMRSCRNNCVFCFLQQMPPGMRRSLYMRDDDYRLSFAQGNYITLTNLSDSDMERIVTQRMGPLHISVHATDAQIRESMMRTPNAGRVMNQLRAFADARVAMHTQIVLCPGVNDGEHLERSVRDMAGLHPWIGSIAVVPVGLTKHRERLAPLQPVNAETAAAVVDSCIRWQKEFRRALGTRLVYPSDEFYMLSGRAVPGCAAYEGFPQLENGVGMTRVFLDDLRRTEKAAARRKARGGSYVLVTGTLAAPIVERLAEVLDALDGVSARACIVKNRFFGETVTVAGLLTGQDVAAALHDLEPGERVIVPDVMLNEGRFLDDMTVEDLAARVGAEVVVAESRPRGVLNSITEGTGVRRVKAAEGKVR